MGAGGFAKPHPKNSPQECFCPVGRVTRGPGLGSAQRALPVGKANLLLRLFAPQGLTLRIPRFHKFNRGPLIRNPAAVQIHQYIRIKVGYNKISEIPFQVPRFGGSWWIRTTEALSSRFTVCPHWPLGKAPIYICVPALTVLDYYSRPGLKMQAFFQKIFLQTWIFC